MINSRCPQPTGIKLSIEATPVIKGTVTGARLTIPGARTSTDVHRVLNNRAKTVSRYDNPESIRKSPRGLRTSPRTPNPQRVFINFFVQYTLSPMLSEDCCPLIKGTLHMLSSKFQTNPVISPIGLLNLTNSPLKALVSPDTETILSHMSTTLPCERLLIFLPIC
jgi:hypothetical protein